MLSRKGGILIGRDNGFRKNGLRERDGAEPRAGEGSVVSKCSKQTPVCLPQEEGGAGGPVGRVCKHRAWGWALSMYHTEGAGWKPGDPPGAQAYPACWGEEKATPESVTW